QGIGGGRIRAQEGRRCELCPLDAEAPLERSVSRHCHARPADDRGNDSLGGSEQNQQGQFRVSNAVRRAHRFAAQTSARRLSSPSLHSVRARLVPILHAAARRASRERWIPVTELLPEMNNLNSLLIPALRMTPSGWFIQICIPTDRVGA